MVISTYCIYIEPNAELTMLALDIAEGPDCGDISHTSTTKSLTLTVFQGILRPMHEKIVGWIAVSDLASALADGGAGIRMRWRSPMGWTR